MSKCVMSWRPGLYHTQLAAVHVLMSSSLLQLMEDLDWVKAKSQVVQMAKYLRKTGSPKVGNELPLSTAATCFWQYSACHS